MTRCLFTVALLFGLALSIAVVALWVRSYSIGDQINFDEPFDGDSLISNNGRIVLDVSSMGGNVGHWRIDPAHDAVTADTYGLAASMLACGLVNSRSPTSSKALCPLRPSS